MSVAAKRSQLDKCLIDFSDGTSLSYRIDSTSKPTLLKGNRFVPLRAVHWATVVFPRAVIVHLPLYTGELKISLHMKAGTTVLAFFDSVTAKMNSRITAAHARKVTAAATTASVLGPFASSCSWDRSVAKVVEDRASSKM